MVQRWEMRLQTHQCMLTRFRVVSQSESPIDYGVGSLGRDGQLPDVDGSVRLDDEFQ